jgi:hypothetical protein
MVTRLLPLLLAVPLGAQAQPDSLGHRGLLLGSAAIAPGFMTALDQTNSYVVGRAEYFLEDRISLCGRLAWWAGAQHEPSSLERHHQLAAGPWLHRWSGPVDLRIGLETGIAITRPALPELLVLDIDRPTRAVPTLAVGAGATLLVWRHFHFFADVRYSTGRYPGGLGGSIPLSEVTVCGGLGFQVGTLKR